MTRRITVWFDIVEGTCAREDLERILRRLIDAVNTDPSGVRAYGTVTIGEPAIPHDEAAG